MIRKIFKNKGSSVELENIDFENLSDKDCNAVENMIYCFKKNTDVYIKNIESKELEVKQLSEALKLEEQELLNKKLNDTVFNKINKLKIQIDSIDKEYLDYVDYLKKRKLFQRGILALIVVLCTTSIILNMTFIKSNMISNQNIMYKQELERMKNLIEEYNDSN